jgi:hypothetical protein
LWNFRRRISDNLLKNDLTDEKNDKPLNLCMINFPAVIPRQKFHNFKVCFLLMGQVIHIHSYFEQISSSLWHSLFPYLFVKTIISNHFRVSTRLLYAIEISTYNQK